MAWGDVAMIVFACTMANHMGLVGAVERTVGFSLPVVNCCKCASWWATMAYYGLDTYKVGIVVAVAMSFLAAYTAVWLELMLGFFDTIYDKAYDWIYDKTSVAATDGNEGRPGAKDAVDFKN